MPVQAPWPPARLFACSPQPRRWTTAEFHFIGGHGLFEGRRPILIDGAILEQGQMTPAFSCALGLTADALWAAFGRGWYVRQQSPFPVGTHTDPVPNISVIRGSPRDFRQHPTATDLIVEVADEHNLPTNTTMKAELYATAGVPEYWVLDLNGRQLHVFRNPQSLLTSLSAMAYQSHDTLGPSERVAPLAAPQASVCVADLLP